MGKPRVPAAEGLVGRDAELALAAAAIHQLSEGRGSTLVIEGEAGIGKTRLVQTIVDDTRARGLAAFCGNAPPFERTRPFGVVAAALALRRRLVEKPAREEEWQRRRDDMRVAIIYRPRGAAAPPEVGPMLMGALGEWVEKYSKRFSTLEFFVIGGGLVLADFDDSADLHRVVAENPFTPYMDVEIMPVVEPSTAMATYGEIVAAFASTMPGPD